MKIAILSPWAVSYNAVGGTERFVQDLAETFIELGNEVDVFMLSGNTHTNNDVNYVNVDFFDTHDVVDEFILQEKCGDFSTTEAYDNIAKILEEKIDLKGYDLVQLNSQLFLKAWKNMRRIFTIHTNPFEYKFAFGDEAYNKMLEVMKLEIQNELTTFVAPSEHYSKLYSDLINANVYNIPHAIDVARIKNEDKKIDLLNKYDLGELNTIRILLPSRVEPVQKQPMVFIEIFERIQEELKSNVQIICTGLDKQYQKYADDIKKFCINNKIDIRFLRFDSMSDAYAIANIVALPSKSESFGYSALESLSLGIPTIMNDLPTFNEILYKYDSNAFIFHNKEELNKITTEILSNIPGRKLPSHEWQERYNLKEWGKKYLLLK